MIWLLLIPAFFLGLLFLLLWLPLELEVDSQLNIYQARWKGVMAIWVVPIEEGLRWFFKIFYWQREWIPVAKASNPKPRVLNPKIQNIKSKQRFSFSIQKIRPILKNLSKTLRLQQLRINWDTGDFLLNAWLYPAFRAASGEGRQLSINFWGKQDFSFLLQTRLGLMAVAGLKVFFILKR